MKRYRILSDGRRYRVQRKVACGPVSFWRNDRVFEVSENYPKVHPKPVEFDQIEEADAYVRERLAEEGPRQRRGLFAIPKGWRVVAKYPKPRPS